MKLDSANLPERDWSHRNVQYLSICTAIKRERQRLSDRSKRTDSTSPFAHILQLGDEEEAEERDTELWDRADYAIHAALAYGQLKAYLFDTKPGAVHELPASYWKEPSSGAIVFRHTGRPLPGAPIVLGTEVLPAKDKSPEAKTPQPETAVALQSFGYADADEIDAEYNDVKVGIPLHKFETWFKMRPAPVHVALPDGRIQKWYDALPIKARSLFNRERLHKEAKAALGERVTMIQIKQIDRHGEGPNRGRVPKVNT